MSLRDTFLNAFTPKSILNRDSDSSKPPLPFGLVHSIETRLTWFCDTDHNGRITSVYKYIQDDGKPDLKCEYIPYSEALERRNYLLDPPDGSPRWIFFVPPKIEMTMDSPSGEQKPLNRKQKRKMAKLIQVQEAKEDTGTDELNRKRAMQE
jgi:hypothetical protein